MIRDITRPTLRLVITDEFGNFTDVTKTLSGSDLGSVYEAIREALVGCGYVQEAIDEWFPEGEPEAFADIAKRVIHE